MRIRQICVKKLFGIFDHAIPMNLQDRITIIHGPNGFGKTTLLKMLDGVFNSKNAVLRTTPFERFGIDFDDGSRLEVTKPNGSNKSLRKRPALEFSFKKPGAEPQTESLRPLEHEEAVELDFPVGMFDRIPGLQRVGPNEWLYVPDNEVLGVEDVLERFGQYLPIPPRFHDRSSEEKWLQDVRSAVPVRFIQTQRLLSPRDVRRPSRYEAEAVATMPAVQRYSQELARSIQAKLAEYATLSQSLDRSFPTRIVTGTAKAELTPELLTAKLSELEQKRSRFMEAGLLEREKDSAFEFPGKIDETKLGVLSVYVKDVEQKLSVLDEMAARIELLKNIINERFAYKNVTITRDGGFEFATDSGRPLAPTSLSSGEQHEVVLLYELLFNIKPNLLVLIDEPEISLHVAWQDQFLRDLSEMTKLSQFDAVLATHSPQIISNRWDLTVQLRSPER